MEYSVIFSSRTGNTAKLAGKIKQQLGEDGIDFFGITGNMIPLSEIVFVGFWTDRGTCDKETANLLQNLNDKKVFLFGTAGFGGSDEYFSSIIEKVKALIPETSTLGGFYMCQGKMPLAVRDRYEQLKKNAPDDERMDALIANFDAALSHPDEEDINNIMAWAGTCMETASQTISESVQ